jgi:hypothetical protein
MRLFAPPAVADNRITQALRTAAEDLFCTIRPVESWLAMIRRKWDKGNRTALVGSLAERIFARICARREPTSFLLNLRSRRITQLSLLLYEDWPVKSE